MNIEQAESTLDKLAKLLHDNNGSDLIISSDSKPGLKINGKVQYVDSINLTPEIVKLMVKSKLSADMYKEFKKELEINFMIDYPSLAQFRTNVFKQKDTMGMVMRLIPLEIPTTQELGLPDYLIELASLKRGLVLFTGGTGVGKSTSLASLIDYRNRNFSDHIITVEDPIEFVHNSKKSIISQREVGIDTHSYQKAMKSALRQAPDVMLIGEIRDVATMEQAMTFAETGHLVFATLHATSAKLSLERIVNLFPHDRRERLLHDLSESLKAIVCQRLMHHASGKGRVAALEIMTNTPHIKMLIAESRLGEIGDAMDRSSMRDGVVTFDNYIKTLVDEGKVTLEEAYLYVSSENNFRQKLRGSKTAEGQDVIEEKESSWTLDTSVDDEKRMQKEKEELEKIEKERKLFDGGFIG